MCFLSLLFLQRSQLLPQLGDNVHANVCAKDREEREEGVGGVERREGVGGGGWGWDWVKEGDDAKERQMESGRDRGVRVTAGNVKM